MYNLVCFTLDKSLFQIQTFICAIYVHNPFLKHRIEMKWGLSEYEFTAEFGLEMLKFEIDYLKIKWHNIEYEVLALSKHILRYHHMISSST